MLLVGLTGGIGAGKSTVARMLAERGAVVIDADDLARRAVDPGTPGLDRLVEAFGREVLAADGGLDRERMAALAFSDPDARRRLEAVVHPEVARLLAEELQRHLDGDDVVVYSVPLLVERNLGAMMDVVVTVSAGADDRVRRLAADRGMDESQVRERMAAQVSDAEREAAADVVLRNDGSLAELEEQVQRLWASLGEDPRRART
ncbi:MAG TPA: dephospho-CoA kinase [Actinomycetota bacterium]